MRKKIKVKFVIMKAAEFKTGLKKVSSQLKGLTLQFITPFGVTPFKSLNAFGNAILKEEAQRKYIRYYSSVDF